MLATSGSNTVRRSWIVLKSGQFEEKEWDRWETARYFRQTVCEDGRWQNCLKIASNDRRPFVITVERFDEVITGLIIDELFVVPYTFAFRALSLQRIKFGPNAKLTVPFKLTPVYHHGGAMSKRRSLWQSERRCWRFMSRMLCREGMTVRSFETSVTI